MSKYLEKAINTKYIGRRNDFVFKFLDLKMSRKCIIMKLKLLESFSDTENTDSESKAFKTDERIWGTGKIGALVRFLWAKNSTTAIWVKK